jgi:hypothetical protein
VEQGYREGARDQWFVQVYPWFETVSGLMGNPDLWSLPPDQTSASFGDAANDLAVEFAEVAGGATKLFDEWLLLEN